jgi:thiol-disulfide isomerase/thioredoxin
MILPLIAAALFATPAMAQDAAMPELELRWSPSQATLRLLPPTGEHLAPDVEALLELELAGNSYTIRGPDTGLAEGLDIGPLMAPPVTIHGTLSVALCTDDGAQCRPLHLDVEQTLPKRRGKLRWTPAEAEPPAPTHAPTLGFDEALAAAATDGLPLLLDFSAQWCPPCQTLAAEVLHAPEHVTTLEGLHLVVLDADDPASWPTKDRYAVGGYPTVIVADAEGYELARLVGYPGEQAFLGWLAQATAHQDTLGGRLRALRAADLELHEAAQLALDLVRADRPAQAWEALERSDDSEPALRAILALESHPDALEWLVANRMDDARSWIWDGLDAMQADPALAAELRPALEAAIGTSEPEQGAEIAAVLAEIAAPDEAPAFYLQAAELLGQAEHEDPAHNRGLWAERAWLYEQAGDSGAALAVLEEAITHYPEEFGYHNSLARLLQQLERLDEAEAEAVMALHWAYGDQRLRAVTQLAGVLLLMDRPQEGLAAIDAVLADFPVPAEGLDVRTHRYLGQIEAMRDDLQAALTTPQGQGG